MRPRTILAALGLLLCAAAEAAAPDGQALRLAVVVCRHGVRAPQNTAAELAPYAAQPWPEWPVPPAWLTPRGKRLMAILGAYYRARYTADGLLSGRPEEDRGRIFFRANSAERTIETARGLSEGLTGDGNPDVQALPAGELDTLFNPVEAGLGDPNRALGVAAVRGRVGGDLGGLVQAYRPQFLALDRVLFGQAAGPRPPGKIELLNLPAPVKPGLSYLLVDVPGPLSWATRITEDLVLEYAEGMPQVGWGRATREDLSEFLELHELYFDLAQRTFVPAQAQASNLASHLLGTMEQAKAGRRLDGAIGDPSDRLVFVVGHDTNLVNLGGLLGLSWSVRGLPLNPTLPGGGLVFELWRHPDGSFFVRTYYISQTLDQMRDLAVLSLESPPLIAPVFMPGCSTAGPDFEAPFERVEARWRQVIDPRCVAR